MALSKRIVDVQLEIYVNSDGTWSKSVGTRRTEVLEDGVVIAERNSQISLTLQQTKNQVANLT